MTFAEQQVQEAFAKLNQSKQAVLNYQNEYGLLDPLTQAEAASRMITEMEAQKVQLETQLRNELTFLKENTPQVTSTKNALESLNKQIEQERSKVAAPKGPKNIQLNTLAAQYQLLKGQLDFDASVYKTAMAAAEKTRVETAAEAENFVGCDRATTSRRSGIPSSFIYPLQSTYYLLTHLWHLKANICSH